MRLVLDTNVVASAVLWGGGPRLLLQAGRERRVRLFTSAALLSELTDILTREVRQEDRCIQVDDRSTG
ncbi:MAG: PIN domain-containing protein [Rhodoferax sp.]